MVKANKFDQIFFNIDKNILSQKEIINLQHQVISKNSQKGIFALSARKNFYLKKVQSVANEITQNYDNLVVCGMGGSSLGAKAICGSKFFDLSYGEKDNNKKIDFLDNIHHQNLHKFLETIDFANTAFLFISKSGNTMETICQTLLIIDYYKEHIAQNKADNLYFVTEETDANAEPNPLAKIAQKYNREVIPHDKDIGGRYSCFTPVALIPAAFYGIDIASYIAGGEAILQGFLQGSSDLVVSGVGFLQYAKAHNFDVQVTMPYLARLYHFNYWYNQLVSESIGKNTQGITILKALGSVDQHSVLQLFLDGTRNKFFSFITTNNQGKGDELKVPDYLTEQLRYLKGRKLGDVIYANQEATIKTITEKGYLLRRFDVKDLDDCVLGQMMMYFMLETILYAKTLDINPFDQPAVEQGKIYAKAMLGQTTN